MTQGMIIAVQGSRNMNARNRFENRDIISTMPDDILGNILSRLTMKEAVRSSVLGTKWRHNWTFFSGVLEFEQSRRNFHLRREHVGILTKCNVFVSEWERFMTHMSKVMKSLKSSSMQGLRICMDLGDPWRAAEWVKYAAEKDVQTLDLDFSYHFSVPIYKMSELTIHNVFPSRGYEMKSLCNLRLSSVDVSGEVIEGFLASCPLLETIRVIKSKHLVRLKVQGEALRLKHLELVDCHIMDLYISAQNLQTLRYLGEFGKFKFQNIPSLVEASFGGIFCSFLQSGIGRVDFYEINVLKLELSMPYPGFIEGMPVFDNVKQLEIRIPHRSGASLDHHVYLLSSFPSVRVLKIKFQRNDLREVKEKWKANMEHEYLNLRELEVSGYRRDPSQMELLINIFEKAPNLNRVVVDPLSSMHVDRSPDVRAEYREMRRETTKWLADSLKPHLSPLTQLIVL
ncbi:F-box/FBD/LRR-repeat protein [Glycine max]|nr:F-box/FBD/LRR-repeat protein [Glycine max]